MVFVVRSRSPPDHASAAPRSIGWSPIQGNLPERSCAAPYAAGPAFTDASPCIAGTPVYSVHPHPRPRHNVVRFPTMLWVVQSVHWSLPHRGAGRGGGVGLPLIATVAGCSCSMALWLSYEWYIAI